MTFYGVLGFVRTVGFLKTEVVDCVIIIINPVHSMKVPTIKISSVRSAIHIPSDEDKLPSRYSKVLSTASNRQNSGIRAHSMILTDKEICPF